MPATGAKGTFATTFNVGNAPVSPEVFVELAEVVSIDGIEEAVSYEDATNMSSPDGYDEVVATGITRTSEITVNVNLNMGDAAQYALWTTVKDAKALKNYRIIFKKQLKQVTFSALVVSASTSPAVDAKAEGSIVFKPSGKPLWATYTP
jgi:hypothetical protein